MNKLINVQLVKYPCLARRTNKFSYTCNNIEFLKYIYDDLDVSSSFSLLSFQLPSFEEAIKDENWVRAMDEEIEAIEKNDTWDLVDLPKDKNPIGVKWVYKTKMNEKDEIDLFKERLVVKLFSQQS